MTATPVTVPPVSDTPAPAMPEVAELEAAVDAQDKAAIAAEQEALKTLSERDLESLSTAEIEALLQDPPKDGAEAAPAPTAEAVAPADAAAVPPASGAEALAGEDTAPENKHVPRERLNQEIQRRRDLEAALAKANETNAYLKGMADAKKPAIPEVDPRQKITVIDANLKTLDETFISQGDALAKKFDDGEISLTEFRKQERALQKNRDDIANQFTETKNTLIREINTPKPEEVAAKIKANPTLQARTEQLKADNPWLESIPDSAFDMLEVAAAAHLEKLGIPQTYDADGTWNYRLAMAEVGREWGFDKIYAPSAPAPATPPAAGATATPPVTQPKDGLTPAQRQAKLALANQQPPVPTAGGVPAPTDAADTYKLDDMTSEEIGSMLPQSTIEKLLGV